MDKKLIISTEDVWKIKDLALQMFHRTPEFVDMDVKEIQTACILMGLDQYLSSKGLNVPYTVQVRERGDSDPVDETGGL